jgi:sarcosine oxidase subunit alpha
MLRLQAPRNPVTLQLDGRAIIAERGEPAVAALLAAGYAALARSPKFHRPRGPACLRAACDGCLARVDGVPNVMTCRVPAHDGMRIETQNVVGSRKTDLLRMADWFFPQGMNHHELFAGVPGLQGVMQAFARRVAGLGRLPEGVPPSGERPVAVRREADALVVGAGAAGMAVALELVRTGRSVEVVDDDLEWGGSLRALHGTDADAATATATRPWAALQAAFGEAVAAARVTMRARTTAAGIYGDDVLLVGAAGGAGAAGATGVVEVVTARTLVLAPGAHDGVLAFEGNDLPGVMSARAAGWLLARGVLPGKRILVVLAGAGGPFGEAYARAVAGVSLERGTPVAARGSSRVKEATVATDRGERTIACDTLLVDAPRAPAYELCAQAGARLADTRSGGATGFVVSTGPGGSIRPGVFAVGEVTGAPLDPTVVTRDAAAVAQRA